MAIKMTYVALVLFLLDCDGLKSFILKMRKLKPREVKELTQTCTANKWRSWSSNQATPLPDTVLSSRAHPHQTWPWKATQAHTFRSVRISAGAGSSNRIILVSWEAVFVYFSDTFKFPLSEISSEFSKHSFGCSFITVCGGFDI